jgi:hypothetical protein
VYALIIPQTTEKFNTESFLNQTPCQHTYFGGTDRCGQKREEPVPGKHWPFVGKEERKD